MTDIAIRVDSLSKLYHLGWAQERHDTLRDTLSASFKRLRRRPSQRANEGDILWALKDVSFEVQRGEVVGIIGRNGAGKSTLLKILSQITEPTRGRAEIHGRVGSLLEVGTGFHPELTGRENVYLNGAILGMRRHEIERQFDEIVAFAEIERFLDTPVKRYSSGMYVRLAFAVAAHLEPEILLVDEVLAVGDAAFQKKCLGKMGDVAREGRTVLFVSHNMAAILSLCERAVLLHKSRLVMSGEPSSLVSHYLMENTHATGQVILSEGQGGLADEFSFCSIRVLKPGGGPTGEVNLREGIDIEITYRIETPLTGVSVVFHLWNGSGTCVLTSTDIDTTPSAITVTRLPGMYRTQSHIPPLFLRPGRYYLGISASVVLVRVLADLPQVITFDVVDIGSVETTTRQGRQGVIAPTLQWTTQRMGT
ncbi:MAG: ABC transporter ATP-binding protein [Anaerolineae bacterium]|nr:ABC transporter ATP-binding protein [Anaerolineae bacterium]